MTDPAATAKALIHRKGVVRSRELVDAGVARVQLSRLVAAGDLIRLARGVYTAPGATVAGAEEGVLVVAERIPEARLCLLTALRLHGLTTQAPFEVWVAIGNKDRPPRLDWPPLKVVRFSGEALTAGLESHAIGDMQVRVGHVAKTVAVCCLVRSVGGLVVAMGALGAAREACLKAYSARRAALRVGRVALARMRRGGFRRVNLAAVPERCAAKRASTSLAMPV
jgi:predicted transcriptional regulator of viral defense system